MPKTMVKIVGSLCLALILVAAVAPGAGALSYYAYLQQ